MAKADFLGFVSLAAEATGLAFFAKEHSGRLAIHSASRSFAAAFLEFWFASRQAIVAAVIGRAANPSATSGGLARQMALAEIGPLTTKFGHAFPAWLGQNFEQIKSDADVRQEQIQRRAHVLGGGDAAVGASGPPVNRSAADKNPAPPKSCADLWSEVNAKTDKIANMTDVEARNSKISAAYAQLKLDSPSTPPWIGLAAIVSRQAGCNMQYSDQIMKEAQKGIDWDTQVLMSPPMGMDDGMAGIAADLLIKQRQLDSAQTAKEALAATNQKIFGSVYPAMDFYAKNGLDKLKSCNVGPDGNPRVDPKLIKALSQPDQGDPRGASDSIARYEQIDVIDNQIYKIPRYRAVLTDNENYSSWRRLWLGLPFGAKRPQIPLSSTCQGEDIPFSGSILDSNDRVSYYRTLMDTNEKNGPKWQQRTLEEIETQ